jgi:DNA-binding GntR family transcriptional regulator
MTSQLIVRLRDRILAGACAPGSALCQDALASEFGTSKIPAPSARRISPSMTRRSSVA